MLHRYSVVVERDEDSYFAYCPSLPGCHTEGETVEDALRHIREALQLYLVTLTPDERAEAAVKEMLTTTVEVDVA